MLTTIIQKELSALILSPKFAATFGACSVLILLSAWIGIRSYQADASQYGAAQRLVEQELVEQTWANVGFHAYRAPDPMQVFASGVHDDVGRLSEISRQSEIKLQSSIYSDSTIFAVFRFVDFMFVVQIVLSLFAILFTYDAVNGEREQGTLQLTFSNPVPRAQFIVGKFIGSWLGLVTPLLIPILLATLLVMVMKVPMKPQHWQALAALMGVSLLYFTFFICFGVLVSTLTRRSSVSFLISLVAWVFLVLIIPRVGVMLAGQSVSVPSVGEIEGLLDGYAKKQWDRYRDELSARWKARNLQTEGMSDAQRADYNMSRMNDWMEEDNEKRKQILAEIAEYERKLGEDRRNRRAQQERLAFALSRFSPASAYQLAAMDLSATDVALKSRSEDAMQAYRQRTLKLADRKAQDSGGASGRMIGFSGGTEGGTAEIRISFSDDSRLTIDPSEVPAYQPPSRSFRESFAPAVIDIGLLALYSLAAFSGAFAAFLRYDVR